MRRAARLTVAALFFVCVAGAARAKTNFVDASVVGGAKDGSSWANAYTNLQDGLLNTAAGDVVWVAKGTYKPGSATSPRTSSFIVSTHQLQVYGGFTNGMGSLAERNWFLHKTILNGDLKNDDLPAFAGRTDNTYHVVSVNANDPVLDGFIIRGGYADGDVTGYTEPGQGGGVYFNACRGPALRNCVLADNAAGAGGAAYVGFDLRVNPAVVENCIFSGNRSLEPANNWGSGVLCGKSHGTLTNIVNFSRCIFSGNTATGSYGGVFYSVASRSVLGNFTNCVVAGNKAAQGGGFYFRKISVLRPSVMNCTFHGNSPSAIAVKDTTNETKNSIFWTNPTAEIEVYNPLAFRARYCDVTNVPGADIDASCFYQDPLWAAGASGTWSAAPTFDKVSGMTLLTHGTAGWTPNAFAGRTVNPDATQNLEFCIASNSATVLYVWGDASIGTSGKSYRIYDYRLTAGSPCVNSGTAAGAPVDDLLRTARPQPPGGAYDMGAYELVGAAGFTGTVVYVDASAPGPTRDGYAWATAFTDLQDALAVATGGKEIWVARGTYKPGAARTNSFGLKSGVALYGGFMAVETNREARDFRANLTYLSGDLLGNDAAVNFETDGTNAASRLDNAYHVLTGANGALLDGFVIVGGYANWGGSNPDITETAWGGGMLVKGSSPVVSNCVFTCNYGYLGGGACVVKDLSTPAFPRFAHCVFSGNWAVDGSAVYDVTSGTYDSCRFAGGDAVGSGGALYFLGGGMPQMVNCILAGNESYFDGAIRVDGGTGSYTNNKLRVVNCTIALNTAQDPNGAVFVKQPSAPTFVNTILWDDTDEGLGVGEIGLQLGGSVILGYCDVEGGVDGIIGGTVTTNGPVLNDDPRFLPPVAGGPWTAVGTYDLARRQTALTVAGSSWTPGAYAGRFINPNVSQRKQFLVYTNTADSVTVWGDADLVADTGNSFRIQNFEIARGSPCVNQGTGTGAPAADIRGEARPRGLAHDIGAYEVEPPAEVPSATVLIVQ